MEVHYVLKPDDNDKVVNVIMVSPTGKKLYAVIPFGG